MADVRESPSFALIDQLTELGAQVDYQDPHGPRTAPQWRPGKPELVSADAVLHDDAALAAYDAVILATNHSAYDYARLARVARLESGLDPASFVRVHKSSIVNIGRVREVEPWFNGDYRIHLQDGTVVALSRRYRGRFEEVAPVRR